MYIQKNNNCPGCIMHRYPCVIMDACALNNAFLLFFRAYAMFIFAFWGGGGGRLRKFQVSLKQKKKRWPTDGLF